MSERDLEAVLAFIDRFFVEERTIAYLSNGGNRKSWEPYRTATVTPFNVHEFQDLIDNEHDNRFGKGWDILEMFIAEFDETGSISKEWYRENKEVIHRFSRRAANRNGWIPAKLKGKVMGLQWYNPGFNGIEYRDHDKVWINCSPKEIVDEMRRHSTRVKDQPKIEIIPANDYEQTLREWNQTYGYLFRIDIDLFKVGRPTFYFTETHEEISNLLEGNHEEINPQVGPWREYGNASNCTSFCNNWGGDVTFYDHSKPGTEIRGVIGEFLLVDVLKAYVTARLPEPENTI
jgi:hypothetical protein